MYKSILHMELRSTFVEVPCIYKYKVLTLINSSNVYMVL